MTEETLKNRLELHYHFVDSDSSHSMDAVIRNKCEHELLQIVNTISREINVQIKIETEAHEEGGLIEFYTFFGSAEGQAITAIANIAVTTLGILISRIPLRKSKLDRQEQQLSIEEKRLNIEAQKLNIESLQKELETKKIETTNINIEKFEYIINSNIKILKYKSNFYKTLYNYPKVKRLSAVRLDANKKQIEEPRFIDRSDFDKFILESDNLEPITDESAIIEIISPVLKKGKYKWRGIYDKLVQPIEFSMTDKEFKEDILRDGISFKSGTFIDCILQISRKIDDLGNIFNSNYSVLTVLRHHHDGISIETYKGKKTDKKRR